MFRSLVALPRFTQSLLLAAFLAACSDRAADQRAIADADLARDLSLVQSAATQQPIFRDTALTNAPEARREVVAPPRRVTRPALVPTRRREAPAIGRRSRQPRQAERPRRVVSAPRPRREEAAPQSAPAAERAGGSGSGAVGAGSVLGASSNARVCTRSNLPGDKVTATVNGRVRGTNGTEIPAGARVVLEVASIVPADPPENGRVVFRVTSVAIGDESYPASGEVTAAGAMERVQMPRDGASDRKKVIGGAMAGAILGQIMGRDTRSTVIGAAAGGAAGAAAAKMSERSESCLPAGTALRITLDQAVVLQ